MMIISCLTLKCNLLIIFFVEEEKRFGGNENGE